ncbi:protein NLRC3 [Centropristis striata]|uniref:protein NLRC3 n=1 Tax=Centropristis striata TaxID=184440 RepID=UPI0027E0F59A|nr:protein NLRC3 [Centropristis striata]XP_059187803.1 protein NLRC3 [Centropristis striata]XP_059187804.1 protein NLRC3 [Centropristis striata]
MEPETEVERIFRNEEEDDEEETKKCMRPPSSYGSMKSDSDEMEEEEERIDEEVPEVSAPFPVVLPNPDPTTHDGTGVQMVHSQYTETLYTMTTDQTKPPGAVVIDTNSLDLGDFSDNDDEEDEDDILIADSPEPPEPVVPDTMLDDENSQPGRLHPEQDLPHVFKSIQSALTGLEHEELLKFKSWYYQWEKGITVQQMMTGDLLDFVDKIIEIFGPERALSHTIRTLENIGKKPESDELQDKCHRALIRYHLTQNLIRKYQSIHEGVVQAGKHNLLKNIYIEPQISTCTYGGVDPNHEIRSYPATPVQVPSPDTFVSLNNLFRLQKDDGKPVKTVLTTGLPGIGMSVSVQKFCMDWAELHANKDMQFVIRLSFRNIWTLRIRKFLTDKMSIIDVLEYYHPECKNMKYLEQEDCKYVVVMDSFDCYQGDLDWENCPVINDNYTKVHPDVLVVNIIRGTVLRGARLWILGRRAAVSQIPSQYIDAVTEIQGFSDEMKDQYFNLRYSSKKDLAAKIVAHYKRLPTLRILTRQPFNCWIAAKVFSRNFRYQDYGELPPRLTPFYVSMMIVQTNRRLQFYYDKMDNELKWSNDDRQYLMKVGKMALKLLERNVSVFYEEDVKEFGLSVTEVGVFSGMCTELPNTDGRRKYCFVHFSYQEFMAAMYVFTTFRNESKNVLESRSVLESTLLHKTKLFASKDQTRSAAGLVQSALTRTLGSPYGHYDMFLRFLCGLISPLCHENLLRGCLFPHHSPKVNGLDEVQHLLEKTIRTAEEKYIERVENLKECLREVTQQKE